MGIIRTLRRDIGSQFAQARNLREPFRTKCRRAFWAVRYLGKAIRIAVISMSTEQLGSHVVYKGMRCNISNWANSSNPTLSGPDGFYKQGVPRRSIKSVRSLPEYLHRFDFGLSFYMQNWNCIDVNKKVYADEYRGKP